VPARARICQTIETADHHHHHHHGAAQLRLSSRLGEQTHIPRSVVTDAAECIGEPTRDGPLPGRGVLSGLVLLRGEAHAVAGLLVG
jgi:hypothetical protein